MTREELQTIKRISAEAGMVEFWITMPSPGDVAGMAGILLDVLDMPPREERRDSTQALFSYAEGYNAALAAVKERIERG